MRSRTSYENTKKHLDKLMSIGVIKKEAGLGAPTSKGIHPVWQYSLVPGGLESIIRNLGLFSNTRVQIIGGKSHGGWNLSKARSPKRCWETCLQPSCWAAKTTAKHSFCEMILCVSGEVIPNALPMQPGMQMSRYPAHIRL